MDSSCFQHPAWYQALTLTERIFSLKPNQTNGKIHNSELAQQRRERWRLQSPFTKGSYFAQRLEMDGITEDELLYLLGEPMEALQSRCLPPDWLVEFVQAFSRPLSSNPHAIFPLEVQQGQDIVGVLDAIEPLIASGRDLLHQGVQALIQAQTDLPFDTRTVELLLLANLPAQLLPLLTRTLASEFHSLQEQLLGETPQERSQSFLQRLRQRDIALAICQKYPVLTRQLILRIDQWVSEGLEFLHHLCADWKSIAALMSSNNDLGLLVALKGNLSERHCGGKTVWVAQFSSGFQVVYKPKPLAAEVRFQELLVWLNQLGIESAFRTLNIIDRGTYGWVEFISAASCNCEAQIQRFYERQGAYLALLYALRATDFHEDNMIAAGEHPMLVDLEMLFQPDITSSHVPSSQDPASLTHHNSVLRVGLLPPREAHAEDEQQAVTPNQPTLNGEKVDLASYTDAIAQGFTRLYQLLRQHRDELLASNGPLIRFSEVPIRIVLRPSTVYETLQNQSFHPDLLQDALERDRFFDHLWIAVQVFPPIMRAIRAERFDLEQGDTPIFTTRPNSRHLWSSTKEQIVDFFAESGLSLVHNRLQQLSDSDLAQQLNLIWTSLAFKNEASVN